MPNQTITPAFDRLKRLFQDFDAAKAQELIQKLRGLASSTTRQQFQNAIKYVFEEIANKTMQTSNEKGFALILEFLRELSLSSSKLKDSMDEISKIKDEDKKQEALIKLFLSGWVFKLFSDQLLANLSVHEKLKRPEYKLEQIQSVVEKQADVSFKMAQTALGQAEYSDEGRFFIRIINLFILLLDVFYLEIGLPFTFSGNGQDEQEDTQLAPSDKKNNMTLRMWKRANKIDD